MTRSPKSRSVRRLNILLPVFLMASLGLFSDAPETAFLLSWLPTLPLAYAFSSSSTTTVPNNPTINTPPKILILPGFGNDASDYFLSQAPQGSLYQSLTTRGWNVDVLQMERLDWLQVFTKGILDLKFWKGDAAPNRPAFSWYLDRVEKAIRDSEEKVIIVAHSAGGWLARAVLGYTCDQVRSGVLGIVTLGTPHLPPPPHVMDMTRGALRITNENFPGAYHDDLFYITVVGNAIQGMEQKKSGFLEPQSAAGFAFNSYKAVCGEGNTIGDGVVPRQSALLDNAVQIELEGVLHSINAPVSLSIYGLFRTLCYILGVFSHELGSVVWFR